MWVQEMEYRGFVYRPDVIEDEDTRKYIHDVYLDGVCIGQIDKSIWYPAKFEDFKRFVEQYLMKGI